MLYLTRKQVRAVDRIAIEKYGVPGIVLMENAALGAARVAVEMLEDIWQPSVLILCGGGNNGGDGLAMARHLHNAGARVRIMTTVDPAKYRGDALINWRIVQAMDLRCEPATADLIDEDQSDLIVDAIFGTGLDSSPRPPFDELAAAVNVSPVPVLSVDIPSGMDCDAGVSQDAFIIADRTVTFVGLKEAFRRPVSMCATGEVTVIEIGCPKAAIEEAMKQG